MPPKWTVPRKLHNIPCKSDPRRPENGQLHWFIINRLKARLGAHRQTFKDQTKSQTSLSNHIHKLKSENIGFEIKWRLVDKGKPFTPVSNVCTLCNKEKYHILFNPELADLNSKSEFYSHCRHKKSKLLVKKERKRKGPG